MTESVPILRFPLAGEVFNRELVESRIVEKTKEFVAVRNRPHPFEMNLYYSL